MALGVEASGGLAHLLGGGVVGALALAHVVQRHVGAGGDCKAEGESVVGDFVCLDLQVMVLHFLTGAVDVDAGLDRVRGAELLTFRFDHGVVGDRQVHEALAGALAVEADPVSEPL